jgi:hypothetical protein
MMAISNFPQLEWRKRIHTAPKQLLGAAGAAMWKALAAGMDNHPLVLLIVFV